MVFGTGEGFLERLRGLGFPARRVGIAIGEAEERALRARPELGGLPREERWRFGVAVFGDVLARATIDDLRPLLDEAAPDLVVYDETDVGAPVAAALAGVPVVTHSLGPQVPAPIRLAVVERLGEVWRSHDPGAAPRDPFTANPYLDICPPSLRDPSAADPAERIPLRPTAPAEPGGGLPAWIARPRERPLAYLTP